MLHHLLFNWFTQIMKKNSESSSSDIDDDDLANLLEFATKVEEENNKSLTAEIKPVQQITKKKNRRIKMIKIFQKDMISKLPKLISMPGEVYEIKGIPDDQIHLKRLSDNAKIYRKMSFMIYSDISDPVHILSFSVYDITIIVSIDNNYGKKADCSKFNLPNEIIELLNDKNIDIICPGKNDWVWGNSDNLLTTFLTTVKYFGDIEGLKYLDDFYDSLYIDDNDKSFCKHIKLFFWLFQVQIDSQLNGCSIPSPLTKKWIDLINFYGKLIFFCYDALLKKQEEFDSCTKEPKSTKIDPIHLENLIAIYQNNTNPDLAKIKRGLVGFSSYPLTLKDLINKS